MPQETTAKTKIADSSEMKSAGIKSKLAHQPILWWAFALTVLHTSVLIAASFFFTSEEPPSEAITPPQKAMVVLAAESPQWACAWYHWDSLWLVHLARFGYRIEILPDGRLWNSNVAFLPGLPAIARMIEQTGLNPWGGLLVFNIFAAFLFRYGLGRLSFELSGSERASIAAMLALSVWPWHFFLIAPYQESAGMAAVVWSLWFVRQNKLIPAFLLGMAASLFRLTSIGLFAGLFTGASATLVFDRTKWRESLSIVVAAAGCFTGWQGLMLYFRYQFGDGQIGIKVQQAWGRDMPHLSGPFESLASAFSGTLTGHAWLDWLASVFTLVSLVFVWRELGFIWASGLFMLVAQALSTGMVVSSGRYMLTAIPLFITGGILAERRPKVFYPLFVFSLLLQLMLLWRYGHGLFGG